MKIERSSPRRARIEIIPLVDVIFILLVFFIYSMLHMVIQRGIPLKLPQAVTTVREEGDFITVSLRRDGRLFLEEEEVDEDTLRRSLKEMSKQGEVKVYLRADEEVRYREVVGVLDVIRQAGITQLALETRRKE